MKRPSAYLKKLLRNPLLNANRLWITDRIKSGTDEIRAQIACAAIEVRQAEGIANVDEYLR